MADSKLFKLIDDVTIDMIANGIETFLRDKKNLQSEGMKTSEGFLVQARQEDSWKKIIGMDSAIQIQIIQAGDMVSVGVGSGKWIDKAGAATIGMLVFAPLTITAAIGAWNQQKLPNEIFEFVEKFIITGGKSVYVSVNINKGSAIKNGEVMCPNCHTANSSTSKFCISCGTKLTLECPNCGKEINKGAKFCPECGASTEQTSLPKL
ncbi:MAG: zinc ribbon domain-containing protein [Clostridium sp.]|nr:zinc ribbon domain-containing protein [Clostridium sp.]